jgi:CsoR family transcriptional regulator, copper-sensing transcriptional repressor
MLSNTKQEALKRLSYLSGHLEGIKRMVEADTYCVDVLQQTHAVRKAIEKLETLMLDGHLRSCVVEGIKEGRDDEVLGELLALYDVANR